MIQATVRRQSVVIHEIEELDWSVEPSADDAEPMPLVRRRAAPRPRTLAGVASAKLGAMRGSDVDDLSW